MVSQRDAIFKLCEKHDRNSVSLSGAEDWGNKD